MKNNRLHYLICYSVIAVCMAVLAVCAPAHASADDAKDITSLFKLSANSKYKENRLYDGNYQNKWDSNREINPAITFSSINGECAYGIYVCFASMPAQWEIQVPSGDQWETLATGSTLYLHTYIALPGVTDFRLIAPSDEACILEINHLCVLSEGSLPSQIQQWEEPPEKADLLLLIARPGAEWQFMGGTIPTYGAESGMALLVACITQPGPNAMSEWLNGLWFAGYRYYPLTGGMKDSSEKNIDKLNKTWDMKDARRFVMEIIRKYRPEVLVTHDIKGENDNAVNKACAEISAFCVRNGQNSAIEPDLFARYGGHDVKKLYLHLYAQNSITLDWRMPLASQNGLTALETAQAAFKLHVSQRNSKISVSDTAKYNNALFGLYISGVGPDENGNDFMENIKGKGEMTYIPPDDSSMLASSNPAGYEDHPAWSAQWMPSAGERGARGFLAEGEYVYDDEDQEGVWFYATPSLIIRIDRKRDVPAKKTWYEAHMYVDLDSDERIRSTLYTPETPGKKRVQITQIARENQVVFGMSTDYYTYRSGVKNAIVGVVIRNGRILHDSAPPHNRSKFPNLDTLAMFGDGEWGVYYSDEYTAQEYLDMGAEDVFSFGPYFVRDGELNPFIDEMYGGKTNQPRCALGMIEKGHYYAMLEEGRFGKEAVGTSLKELAVHMHQKGCVQALNLDGGQTAVWTFMGKQITRIAVYQSGGGNLPRATSELICVGVSPLVGVNLEGR